jgi:hypothetical protein
VAADARHEDETRHEDEARRREAARRAGEAGPSVGWQAPTTGNPLLGGQAPTTSRLTVQEGSIVQPAEGEEEEVEDESGVNLLQTSNPLLGGN